MAHSRRPPGAGPARSGRDDGLTLIEVVMAMAVFAVGVTALLGVLLNTTDVVRGNLRRTTAANLVNENLEEVRASTALAIDNGRTISTRTVNGVDYTVTRNVSLLSADSSTSVCTSTSSSTRLAYKLIRVSVTWPEMGSVQPVTGDVLRAVEAGSIDSTKNTLTVLLQDWQAQPVAGVSVALSDGSSSQTTGDDGCVVFTGLSDGVYTATVNRTGYVGTANNQSTSTSPVSLAAVTTSGTAVGAVQKLQLSYDTVRSLGYTFGSPVSGAVLPTGLPIRISTGVLPVTTVSAVCTTGSTSACRTDSAPYEIHELFPAIYTVKAGSCTAASSEASIDVRATGADGTIGTIPMAALTVRVQNAVGTDLPNRTVTITPADSGVCPAGDSYTTTSATGGRIVLVPYGSWVLTANGTSASVTATVGETARTASVTLGGAT